MRKITREAVNAFMHGGAMRRGNTAVITIVHDREEGPVRDTLMTLHRNPIAWCIDGETWITDAGWPTATTKERLNGLPGVSIVQRAGQWYLNGKEWDGEWVKVS